MTYKKTEPKANFSEIEHNVLQFWQENDTFHKSLNKTKMGEPFNFYDGPPFATGMPHYGHLIAGGLKDVVTRYWTQRGRYCVRRFGWDCHGLPIETIINKNYRALLINDIDLARVGTDTSFQAGFQEAEQFLEYGNNFDKRRVLFLTDGEDSGYNQIEDTCRKMKEFGYQINIIGFGEGSLFENLKQFASEGCFNTRNVFEEVKEICYRVFSS